MDIVSDLRAINATFTEMLIKSTPHNRIPSRQINPNTNLVYYLGLMSLKMFKKLHASSYYLTDKDLLTNDKYYFLYSLIIFQKCWIRSYL